jgi:pimeloyl-ACP methyl ester carboxylesterase
VAAFREGHIELDGLRIGYADGGQGPALLCLCDAGELRIGRADDLLAEQFRVVLLEMPDTDGLPPDPDLAGRIAGVATALGVTRFSAIGGAAHATPTLSLALQQPARVEALVLVAPEVSPPDLEIRLREVSLPTLLLFGTREGAAPAETARLYCEALPNCHLLLVYDAGRDIAADRPEAFAAVVTDFLQHHESFIVTRTSGVIHP